MREKFKYAGQTVKTKQGVGTSSFGQDMSEQDFIVEDWWENVSGCSWMNSNGNPAALEYAVRSAFNGENNMYQHSMMMFYMGKSGHSDISFT